jgi:hypothetical protein
MISGIKKPAQVTAYAGFPPFKGTALLADLVDWASLR